MMDEYFCSNCGDSLKNQIFYSEYDDNWECTSCGAKLHRDYASVPYEIVDDEETNAEEEKQVSNSYLYSSNKSTCTSQSNYRTNVAAQKAYEKIHWQV